MDLTRRQFLAASSIGAAVALGGCSALAPTTELSDDEVGALIGAMTTRQKVQQMIVCGLRTWKGDEEDAEPEPLTELPDQLRVALDARAYGGVIFFGEALGSPDASARLISDVRSTLRNASAGAGVAPLLAVDQEGGLVTRLTCASPVPSQMALGAAGDDLLATEVAGVLGAEVASVGLNMDFSPVMDINSNPSNPIIGTRSFSSDRSIVATMGTAFMQGLDASGVIACAKHFPGHGNTDVDSHTGLPSLSATLDDLRAKDTAPYRVAIDAGLGAIMTAHIVFPNIEDEMVTSTSTGQEINLPATMSQRLLTDYLRGELRFGGVIISDSMVMGAITEHFEPIDAAIRAINAGCDILLNPFELTDSDALVAAEDYVNRLVEAVEVGDISIDTINASVSRILRLKADAGLLSTTNASADDQAATATRTIATADNRAVCERAAARAVTLLRNQDATLPIQLGADGRALIVYTRADKSKLVQTARDQLVSRSIVSSASQVDVVACTSADDVAKTVEWARSYGTILVVTEMFGASDLDPASKNGYQYALLDALVADAHPQPAAPAEGEDAEGEGDAPAPAPATPARRVVHVSANLPYDVACSTSADATLACFGTHRLADPGDADVTATTATWEPTLAAALRMAFGENAPMGTCPVAVPAINDQHAFDSQTLYQLGAGIKDWGA